MSVDSSCQMFSPPLFTTTALCFCVYTLILGANEGTHSSITATTDIITV